MFILAIASYLGLILLAWIVFEAYLLWINYKGRFRYKLLERSEKKRELQSKVGVLALPISSVIRLVPTLILSIILKFAFDLSFEVAFALGFSALVGLVVSNADFDKGSVEAFERYCSRCKNKRECNDFLNKNCQLTFLKHRVKMAISLDQKTDF